MEINLNELQFEKVCDYIHQGWQEEKHRQGVWNHPDDIPYDELPENVKEYDRATVRSAIKALKMLD